MSESKKWIDRWINVLNTQDADLAATLLSPNIRVRAYHLGAGGPETIIDGLEAVIHWTQRLPAGSFSFERISDSIGSAIDVLPPGDLTVQGQYRVCLTEGDFSNTGKWTISISDDVIVGILHVPQPLVLD